MDFSENVNIKMNICSIHFGTRVELMFRNFFSHIRFVRFKNVTLFLLRKRFFLDRNISENQNQVFRCFSIYFIFLSMNKSKILISKIKKELENFGNFHY